MEETLDEISTLLFSAASRRDSPNFAFGYEVVPCNRVAMPIRCHLHACCLDETRRDATLVETQRGDLGSVIALGLPQTTMAARRSKQIARILICASATLETPFNTIDFPSRTHVSV